jgi:hypothetical protein
MDHGLCGLVVGDRDDLVDQPFHERSRDLARVLHGDAVANRGRLRRRLDPGIRSDRL